LHYSLNSICLMIWTRMGWAWHTAFIEEKRGTYWVLVREA